MSNEATFRAGDRAVTKIGRNLVEVRVKAKAENGWTVETRSGKTLTVKSLESRDGETAAATAASIALPPIRSASRPAAAACGLEQLTMPPPA